MSGIASWKGATKHTERTVLDFGPSKREAELEAKVKELRALLKDVLDDTWVARCRFQSVEALTARIRKELES